MAGWIYIILCTIASVSIAHFFKVSEKKKLSTLRVITINYLVAFPIAFILYESHEHTIVFSQEFIFPGLLALLTGIVFIFNFFIYSKSVDRNGVGISIAAMRISLIVPVLLSTMWYKEFLSLKQWLGLMLVFVVLYLLLPNKKSLMQEATNAGWLLPVLFVMTAVGDAALKVYEADFSRLISKGEFMGFVFLTAFLVGIALILLRREWTFTKKEFLIGACIGIPNLLAATFLLEALERMNGAVVFSSVNVLTVLGGTLVGVTYWKDRFTKTQWSGIFLTVISILLLF